MTADARPLRPWSSLSEEEQTRLLSDYQPVLDTQSLTCSLDMKLARMQEFLRPRGVSITEEDLHRPKPRAPRWTP